MRLLRTGLLLAVLSVAPFLGGAALQAKPVELDATALRQLANLAVQQGFADQALRYTDALLFRDNFDTTALIIRAQALRALGRAPEAVQVARTAWRIAKARGAKAEPAQFGAAMAMAQAQSTLGRRTVAQLWLRRAAQHAPNPEAYAIARRDFGYVQSRNPWRLQFDFSGSPSSNVNNGSRQSRLSLIGVPVWLEIPAESQALSGLQYGVAGSATLRFSPTGPNRQTEAKLGLAIQNVALSAASQAAAPLANSGDYAFGLIEAGLSHHRSLGAEGRTQLALTATLGHNWYGGNDLSDYVRLSMGLDQRLNDTAALSFGVTVDHNSRLDSPKQSSDRLGATIGYSLMMGTGHKDRLSLEVEAAGTTSESAEVRSQSLGLNIGWKKAEAVAGIALSGGLSMESQIFADSRYVLGGRQDLKVAANLTLTFQNVEYMGFSPVLQVQASRNQSNSALHDSQNLGLTLGISSSF